LHFIHSKRECPPGLRTCKIKECQAFLRDLAAFFRKNSDAPPKCNEATISNVFLLTVMGGY
jgi:hypothetical protein